MVGEFNSAVGGRTGGGKVPLCHAENGLAPLQSGDLDHRDRIGEHVVSVGAVGGHDRGSGHDLLIVVLGIDQEN